MTATTNDMTQHAYSTLEEILGGLASAAYVEVEFGEANDPRVITNEADIRNAYERIVQQVFPLVAMASVLEANAGLVAYAAELAAQIQAAAAGFLPEPTCPEPDMVGQMTLPDEFIPKPKISGGCDTHQTTGECGCPDWTKH